LFIRQPSVTQIKKPPVELRIRLTNLVNRGKLYFLVATLDYLARTGKIGGASAFLGNTFLLMLILTLIGGKVESHPKARAFKKSLEHLKALVINEYPRNRDVHLSRMYTNNLSLADEL